MKDQAGLGMLTPEGVASDPEVRETVRRALAEDIGPGDVTTLACVEADRKARGEFIARQPMVAAGLELLAVVYDLLGGVDLLELLHRDGDSVQEKAVLARVEGAARTLLTAERVSLNFLQRLSGVASVARLFADTVAGTGCRILDTRKTTPGLRRLEKMAAAAGGVVNHRMGLYDAILIKNNHIAAAGGVAEAIRKARVTRLPVEIEVRNREELIEALEAGANRVLLDNLTPREAAIEVAFVGDRAEVEISGGVTLANVREYADAAPDYISSGAITHSAVAVDINFRLELL